MKGNESLFSRLGTIGSTVFLAFAAPAAPMELAKTDEEESWELMVR